MQAFHTRVRADERVDPSRLTLWPGLALIVLLATLLSIAMTGFEFGVGNNVFHLPYVLRYDELPALRADAATASLRKFTSVIWPALRAVGTEANVASLFFISHVLSRAAALLALAWLFRANGLTRPGQLVVAMCSVAACGWLAGSSPVGDHGLFIRYFTHSEVSWAPLVAAIVATQRRQLWLAAAFAGIAFLINAFVGLWTVAVLSVVVLARDGWRAGGRGLVVPAMVFVVVCAPVAVWIGLSLQGQAPVPAFSYIAYIRAYYPAHFLVEAASARDLLLLGLLAFCGLAAAWLSRDRRFWLSALGGAMLLLVIGAVLPYGLDHRFVFNLHLLRADGVLQFLALVLAIVVLVDMLADGTQPPAARMLAALAAGLLVGPQAEPIALASCALCLGLLVLVRLHAQRRLLAAWQPGATAAAVWALAAMLAAAQSVHVGVTADAALHWLLVAIVMGLVGRGPAGLPVWVPVAWAMLAVASAGSAAMARKAQRDEAPVSGDAAWRELVQWVGASAMPGPFLVPVDAEARSRFYLFQLQTRKPVWVDWKQGAVVMWEPAFYWQWMPRMRAVSALRTAEEFGAYAADNAIEALVLPRRLGACPANTRAVFGNTAYQVCSVGARP